MGSAGAGPHTTEGAPGSNRNEKTAENIRYGQNISESGVGGFTQGSTGKASQEGGYGGTTRDKELETDGGNARTAQGYGSGSGVGG